MIHSLVKRMKRAAGVIVGLITLVAVAIAIPIGYIVLATVVNTVPSSSLSSSQQTNLTNIGVQVTNAFLLTTVVPTVLAAGLIIGALFLFFHFRTSRGE